MREGLIIAAATGIAAGAAWLAFGSGGSGSAPSKPGPRRVPYPTTPGAPFGPYHRARRPSGLPLVIATASGGGRRVIVDGVDPRAASTAAGHVFKRRFKSRLTSVRVRAIRPASARGAALPVVEAQAARHGHGRAFVQTVTHLARTEGEGGTFAVPARNFNAACRTLGLDRA